MLEATLTLLLVLGMFVLVLVLAYLTTKYVGKKYAARGQGTALIKIVDRMAISQDKQLLVVSVAGKVMLIGAAPHAINKLCDLDEKDLPPVSDTAPGPAFSQVLSSMLHDGFASHVKNRDAKKKDAENEDAVREDGPRQNEQ